MHRGSWIEEWYAPGDLGLGGERVVPGVNRPGQDIVQSGDVDRLNFVVVGKMFTSN